MKQYFNRQAFFSYALKSIKIFPSSARFGLGKTAAKVLSPFARRFSLVSPPPFALDSDEDYLWSVLFNSLTHHGIKFDPKIILRQAETDITQGAIMVSGHFYLNFFVMRWLHDNDYRQSTVIRDEYDRQKVLGTTSEIDVIKPNAECLLEIKKRVNAGEIVSICIDHCEPLEGWQKLAIPNRRIYISDSIFKFAGRFGIPLIFFGTQVNADNEIEIHTARPVSKKPAEVSAEFGEFLKGLLTKPGK